MRPRAGHNPGVTDQKPIGCREAVIEAIAFSLFVALMCAIVVAFALLF